MATEEPLSQTDEAQKKRSSNRRLMRRVVLIDSMSLLFVFAAVVIWKAADAILLFFACILFAIMLFDLSRRIEQWLGVSHGLALTMVSVILFGSIGIAGWLMAPQVAQQAGELIKTIPESLQKLHETLERHPVFSQLGGMLPTPDEIADRLTTLLPKTGLVFSGLVGILGNIAIIVFIGVYLAAQPKVYLKGVISLIPRHKQLRAAEVIQEIGQTLGQWMAGKAVSMLVVGIATTIGLTLLDIPLALVLGIIAGLLDFVPYVGPIVAGVPAILIAFTENPLKGGYVALLFFSIQLAEGYLLMPLIDRRTVSLPPAITIAMQVLLGTLVGMAGIALATPLAAVLMVMVTMLYVQDVLDDPVQPPSKK